MTYSDPLQFDYFTADWYWLLYDETLQDIPQSDCHVLEALCFLCDTRLLRDTEVMLAATGCLDAAL
jgi:hypothetical protein